MIKYLNIIQETLKNAQDFFEKLLTWEISFLEIEKKIRNFVNEKIIKPLFLWVFQYIYLNLKNQSQEKAIENWYMKLKTKDKKIKIYTWDTIKIPTYYGTNDGKKWMKKGIQNVFLEQLWFIDSCSPLLTSDIVSSWSYCPSFQVASNVLLARWIQIDDNKIASLSYKLSDKGLENRGKVSFEKWESFEWKDIIIMIDWWRICTREAKQWRPKKWAKWKWFKWVWREPKCFVIWELENGRLSKNKPLYDWKICSAEEMYEILELYLIHWKIETARSVTIAWDGAKRIWEYAKKLLIKLWVDEEKITEVLDYFHWVEHISIFTNNLKLKAKTKKQLFNRLKNLLWEWETKELLDLMKKQEDGINKGFHEREINYFTKHSCRISYSTYRKEKKPCWSGTIESMIRRVVNLRLKWPSIFWKKENANKALFLRSQLLAWRWNIFLWNILSVKLFLNRA